MSAFVLAVPLLAASAVLSVAFQGVVGSILYRSYAPQHYIPHNSSGLWLMLAAGLVAVLLWFGFVNHRTSDRSAARTAKQALAIGAYVTIGMIALIASTLG